MRAFARTTCLALAAITASILFAPVARPTAGTPLYGSAWDDLRIPVNTVSRLGTTDPGWAQVTDDASGSVGVYALAFDGAGTRDEEVFFSVQMPHSWREGTPIKPHVHWAPTDAAGGNVRWVLEYVVVGVGAAVGDSTLVAVNDPTDTVAWKHQIAAFAAIDMTGQTLSTMLLCRLMREATDAADTYNNQDALLFEVDFHYRIDRPGSRQEYIK